MIANAKDAQTSPALAALVLALLTGATTFAPASAAQFSTIYTFTGGADGAYPAIGLLRGEDGSLYGATEGDGHGFWGTVFRLNPPKHPGDPWTKDNLYAFGGKRDGAYPWTRLIFDMDTGALLGTTAGDDGHGDLGTIFRLVPPKKKGKPWTEQIIHRFTGGTDSGFPYDGLVQDPSNGAIYGTAYGDSVLGDFGTVFGYTPDLLHKNWSETLHYNFTGLPNNGAFPEAGLVLGQAGVLYGTTFGGGTGNNKCDVAYVGGYLSGCGVVFSMHIASGQFENLFEGSATGDPSFLGYGELLLDDASNIYGTSVAGGKLGNCKLGNGLTCGTVYTLAPEAGTKATVIQGLTGQNSGQSESGLIWDITRTVLFGTTTLGGPGHCKFNGIKHGCGEVFKLVHDGDKWVYVPVYSFQGGADGYRPHDLVIDSEGTLYGEAELGGINGRGTIFKIESP